MHWIRMSYDSESLLFFTFLLANSCQSRLLECLHVRLECRYQDLSYACRTQIPKYRGHLSICLFDPWPGADWLGWLSQRRLQRWANLFEVLRTYTIELRSGPE